MQIFPLFLKVTRGYKYAVWLQKMSRENIFLRQRDLIFFFVRNRWTSTVKRFDIKNAPAWKIIFYEFTIKECSVLQINFSCV